jgi:uncharacterized protein YrrD
MQIALGQAVYTSDGQRIGTIDRVLLNPVGNQVEHFVVHRGFFFDDDKVVARISIDRVDGNGVYLSIDAQAAKALTRFEHSFDVGEMDSGYPEVIPGPFQSTVLFPVPPSGMTYLHHGRLFQLDPPLSAEERQSNEPVHTDVVIGKGADVIDPNGLRIGYVHEVAYDDDGALEVVVVQTGLLRHHRVTILAEQIAEIGDEEIRLRVPADTLANSE